MRPFPSQILPPKNPAVKKWNVKSASSLSNKEDQRISFVTLACHRLHQLLFVKNAKRDFNQRRISTQRVDHATKLSSKKENHAQRKEGLIDFTVSLATDSINLVPTTEIGHMTAIVHSIGPTTTEVVIEVDFKGTTEAMTDGIPVRK